MNACTAAHLHAAACLLPLALPPLQRHGFNKQTPGLFVSDIVKSVLLGLLMIPPLVSGHALCGAQASLADDAWHELWRHTDAV